MMPEISVTCHGIENLLNGFQTHKATGPNAISAKILRATSDIIAPILQIIFQTYCYSSCWLDHCLGDTNLQER